MIAVFAVFFSCQKEQFITGGSAKLQFSTDTVAFDTVFTSIGTTTKRLKVYNPYNKSIKISSISLAQAGDQSYFRLNIDGLMTSEAKNIELPPKDSLYIFVEATIDPTLQNAPLQINDSIVFVTNNNIQDVNLVAWGQDVHLFTNNHVFSTQRWENDKPYLLIDTVYIDFDEILTIDPGVNIHLHKDAFLVVAGTIEVLGTVEEPVTFQGDRLEEFYDDIPGQWGRIIFLNESRKNIFRNCTIKNGIIGLNLGTPGEDPGPDVLLYNTLITNMSSAGIFALNARVNAYNTVIANCGQFLFTTYLGGSYEFVHCTFANYWGTYSNRRTPSIVLKNYVDVILEDEQGNEQDVRFIGNVEKAYFGNSIIYGNAQDEFGIDPLEGQTMNFSFANSLLRLRIDSIDASYHDNFVDCIFNEDPEFFDIDANDIQLDTLSPAKDAGKVTITEQLPLLEFDFNGKNRLDDNAPDLGAYERKEGEEE